MELSSLTALCPLDGRYRATGEALAPYFSEMVLIRYRVRVEIEYFIDLCQIPQPQRSGVRARSFPALRAIYENFTEKDALRIKEIEKTTNHDVKAVEYFIKECFDAMGLAAYKEFIHFGLTRQDINNTATPLSIKDAVENVYLP